MSKARDIADLGAVTSRLDTVGASDGALSNRNLIINGAMQVAQRGTSATYSSNTSRGFVCDRWFAEGYPLNMTITQSAISYDGINYKSSSLSSITGAWTFFQSVEDSYAYNAGKTLTLSFVASGSGTIQPITWIGTVGQQNFGSSIALTGTPTRYEVTHTITGSGSGSTMFVGFSGSGGSMNISLVQLEVGDTATPFEHRSYGDELQRCMRYTYRINGHTPDQKQVGAGFCYSSVAGRIHVSFPVPMRAEPSMSSSGMDVLVGAGNDPNVLVSTTFDEGTTGCGLIIGDIAGGGTGDGLILRVYNTASAYIEFDAEL